MNARIAKMLRATMILVVCLLTTLFSVPTAFGQRPPSGGGSGGNWLVTFDRNGSKLVLHCWSVYGQPGGQTISPKIEDRLNGQPPATNGLGFMGYWTTYYPTPDMRPAYALNRIEGSLKVSTTYQWQGTGAAPPTLKLCLYGSSYGQWSGASGSCEANNGLRHPEVRTSNPTNGTVSVSGRRYREFKVAGGKVQFVTTLTTSSSSQRDHGSFNANCSISVSETNWAVGLDYDRVTSHRETNAQGLGIAVVNGNSGDGATYADTIGLQMRKRTTYAICYNGAASDWGASKWKINGYVGDTTVVLTERVQPVRGSYVSPVGVPWNGTVSG